MEKTANGSDVRQQILIFIQQFRKTHGYAPTQQEIASGVGLSPSSVYYHLNVLERNGQIARKRRIARALFVL
jgi:SOS-response transcriptional repressor LexA